MTIGNAIKQYRRKRGMTQLDLAIMINRTVRSVIRYEKGETIPSIQLLEKIFNSQIEPSILDALKKSGVL